MSEGELSPVAVARRWAEAVVQTVGSARSVVGAPFDASLTSDPDVLPQVVLVGPVRDGDPSIELLVEEAQGFLSIDRVPGVHVMYEFEGSPSGLRKRFEGRAGGSRVGAQALDEVAMTEHVISIMQFGFSFFRIPLFEKISIFGPRGESILKWITYDLSWPPVMVRQWRP